MMHTIDITMPVSTAKLILKLVRIAKKIHKFNVDLIDMKEALAGTNEVELEELEQELDRLIS